VLAQHLHISWCLSELKSKAIYSLFSTVTSHFSLLSIAPLGLVNHLAETWRIRWKLEKTGCVVLDPDHASKYQPSVIVQVASFPDKC
jgi:hypothetical protein